MSEIYQHFIIFNSLLVITPKVFNYSACKLLENLIWTMEGRQFDSLMHSLYLTDGGYSEWSIFSPCTAKCDGDQGNRVRRRFCINPEPSFGGNNCDGELSWICLTLIPNFHLYFLLGFFMLFLKLGHFCDFVVVCPTNMWWKSQHLTQKISLMVLA